MVISNADAFSLGEKSSPNSESSWFQFRCSVQARSVQLRSLAFPGRACRNQHWRLGVGPGRASSRSSLLFHFCNDATYLCSSDIRRFQVRQLQLPPSKAASTMASTVLGKRSRRSADTEGTTRAFLREKSSSTDRSRSRDPTADAKTTNSQHTTSHP